MSEKIDEIQQKLKEHGYFASKDLAKLVLLFNEAGKKIGKVFQHYFYKESLVQVKLF